jgi:hypothetical protein
MILLLATPRGRVNGIMFGTGWLAGLAVLGAVVLLIAGPSAASSGGEPAAWVGWLKLVLGVLALLLAVGGGAASQRKAPSRRCPSGWLAYLQADLDDAVDAFTAGERHTRRPVRDRLSAARYPGRGRTSRRPRRCAPAGPGRRRYDG